MGDRIPQAHGCPDFRGVPLGHSEDRVEADARQWHAFPKQELALPRHLEQPLAALLADMGSFGDHHFTAVASPNGAHELGERQAAGVIVGERRDAAIGERRNAPLPLIGPIVVYPHDIEMGARTAEFRESVACQDVPSLEDEALVEILCFLPFVRTLGTDGGPA
jgi:hypothetical protein